MFPISLVRRLIDTFLPEGSGVVLDPFAGSGTTLVAAEQSGKTGVGFELSPEFFNLAMSRLRTSKLFRKWATALPERSVKYIGDDEVDLCVTSPLHETSSTRNDLLTASPAGTTGTSKATWEMDRLQRVLKQLLPSRACSRS